jgi:hypothetical protein
VEAVYVFYKCFNDQFLEDVKIGIKYFWVLISFDKKDTILPTHVLGFKAILNFAGPSDYRFFLNDKEFLH